MEKKQLSPKAQMLRDTRTGKVAWCQVVQGPKAKCAAGFARVICAHKSRFDQITRGKSLDACWFEAEALEAKRELPTWTTWRLSS